MPAEALIHRNALWWAVYHRCHVRIYHRPHGERLDDDLTALVDAALEGGAAVATELLCQRIVGQWRFG